MFSIQVKHRNLLPTWLTSAWRQAKRDAKEGEVPLLVVCQSTQGKRTERYVIMEMATFIDLHGDLEVADGDLATDGQGPHD